MGLDRHAVAFLRYASREPLGEVATMGRQGLAISPDELRELIGSDGYGDYCETLLVDRFGASLVDSYDYSDFEGATHLIDLNQPVEPQRQYDTIIDAGTLEHVFNAPEAFRTMAKMCRVGGRIIHVSPSNNFCNHGFWQLSPELFFSLYSEGNGFAETEVFMSDLGERSYWYRLTPPAERIVERCDVPKGDVLDGRHAEGPRCCCIYRPAGRLCRVLGATRAGPTKQSQGKVQAGNRGNAPVPGSALHQPDAKARRPCAQGEP